MYSASVASAQVRGDPPGRENPAEPSEKEAKRIEALELLRAAFTGDDSQSSRRNQLVAEIRADETIDAAQRAEVASYAENFKVQRRSDLAPTQRLVEFERTARVLIEEFSEVESCYESLMSIARAQSEARAQAIADDLLQMPEAPGHVKKEAFDLRARCNLIGAILADVVSPAEEGTADLEHTRGKQTIIYSWSSENGFSLWLAGEIARLAPRDAVIIGLNLDEDPDVGRKAAAEQTLPGDQIYGLSPHGRPLRWALRMTEPLLVYVAGADGVLRSVSAQRNLSELLAPPASR